MDINYNSGRIFCTKCGTANKAGYRFCVKCGTKLMTPVARPQPEAVQELPKAEPVKVDAQLLGGSSFPLSSQPRRRSP